MSEKLIELEDRSRRNDLHIVGLTGNTSETWDDCEKKVQEVLQNKLNIQDDIEIDGCHRMGKRRESGPRTVICRFVRFKDKQRIYTAKFQETKEHRNLYLSRFLKRCD